MSNPEVDAYIERSDQWPAEISALRPILLDAGLTEEVKWRKPCYTHDGSNIAIVQEMKDFLALMFFKGSLLADPDGVLEDQGPNSRSARRMCFSSVDDVERSADIIRAYVREAIDVERSGLRVEPAPDTVVSEELRRRLDRRPDLRAAFDGLTPGRRREYDLYISNAKRAETREVRIDTCIPKILAGKGLRDR